MKTQLSTSNRKSITQTWNMLVNINKKNLNYYIPTSIEEYSKIEKLEAHFKINSQLWILRENTKIAVNEITKRIYDAFVPKGVICYKTVYAALKKELEVEISNRDKDPTCKREFADALECIEHFVDGEVSHFDFYYAVEGLELKDLDKVSRGNVEILVFNQGMCDQMTTDYFGETYTQNSKEVASKQDFFNNNFLNRLCIKSTAFGDYDTANKQAYRQVRELINYFRYILCLYWHNRVTDKLIKINLSSEACSNKENIIIKRICDSTIFLASGRGRKPLQNFLIDKNLLEDLLFNGFLDDFFKIINASTQTQLEGCILTAIYWIGEAQNENDLDVSFLKYWTALECIFTGSEQPTKALAKGVATLNAFSGYEFIRVEDLNKTYKSMTKLYGKRSDIIHRGMNYLANQVIIEADISEMCRYTAWSIYSLFHLRSDGYTDMQAVGIKINELFLKWDGKLS
jgi:hypothetical protein